jgi:hypothetical protein
MTIRRTGGDARGLFTHGAGFSYNIRGVAPYWRAAYPTSSNNNCIEIGSYGMHVKSTPDSVTGLKDSYTDWGHRLGVNGAQVNYDRAGRNASANNTVYLLPRFVF